MAALYAIAGALIGSGLARVSIAEQAWVAAIAAGLVVAVVGTIVKEQQ